MRLLCVGCVACVAALGIPLDAMAQATEMEFDLQQRAVVRVASGAGTGSGLIVGVSADGKRLTVVTARHVLEGDELLRVSEVVLAPDSTAKVYPKRKCRTLKGVVPKISYKFDKNSNAEAKTAYCTDAMDVAVLEVDLDAALQTSIPPFRQPSDLSASPGNTVNVLGIPQGTDWSRLPPARIVLNNTAKRSLELDAPGVQAGFSGGPVLDRYVGLVGMVVREANPTAIAVPWLGIAELLSDWQVEANRLQGRPGESNPSFTDPPEDNAEEGARNAIRQYQIAFANKDLDRMRAVYPNIVRSVQKLFGDSVRSDLNLAACTDIALLSEGQSRSLAERVPSTLNVQNAFPVHSLDCEFELIVYRRTGPDVKRRSSKFPVTSTGEKPSDLEVPAMTFYLQPSIRESLWQIVDVDHVMPKTQ